MPHGGRWLLRGATRATGSRFHDAAYQSQQKKRRGSVLSGLLRPRCSQTWAHLWHVHFGWFLRIRNSRWQARFDIPRIAKSRGGPDLISSESRNHGPSQPCFPEYRERNRLWTYVFVNDTDSGTLHLLRARRPQESRNSTSKQFA